VPAGTIANQNDAGHLRIAAVQLVSWPTCSRVTP
jgi:hypothetical protein